MSWEAWEDDVLRRHWGRVKFWRLRRMLPDRSGVEIRNRAEGGRMYEVGDKTHRRCCVCEQTKPLEQFRRAANKPLGRTYFCMPCHRAKDAAYHRTSRATKVKPVDVEVAYPLPRMDLVEQLDCRRLKKWRGPVNDGPMVASLGVAA